MKDSELIRIQKLLSHFGCNQNDANIYLKCLEIGPASVQEISNKVKKNRITVHGTVEKLIQKGILTESRQGKKRLIIAESADVFQNLLQKKYNDLKLVETNLKHSAEILNSLQKSDRNIPTVKFYEDINGLKKMLEESLEAKGIMSVISNVELLSELLDPIYLERYFKRRSAKGVHTRLIFPPCKFAEQISKKKEEYRVQIKLIPEDKNWQSGIFAWNEKIALLSYTEGKITCTIIQNSDIAYFFGNIIFDSLWKT